MLTKHEIAEYYSDPTVRSAILSQIQNKPVMAIHTLPKGDVVRRNDAKGKPIRILQARNDASNRNDLAWYTDRRFSEFHPTIGRNTRKVWVDIDPGPKADFEELKPTVARVENALREMPEVKDTSITYSGDRGFHVRGTLYKKMLTNAARQKIDNHLKSLEIPGAVFRPPKKDEVRLDTSTLQNKGALRAEYSLNSTTGRVAVPLTQRELRGFRPEQAEVGRILKEKEFAPGIPRSKRIYSIPDKAADKQWVMAVQEHHARKAGKHWDLRLVDPETGFAHSWAVPKARLPEGNQKVLAVRTPTHTENYALNFGAHEKQTIGKGYGSGTVEMVHKEPVKIIKADNNRVQFDRIIGDDKERLTLFRTKGDAWLLRGHKKEDENMKTARETGYAAALAKLGMQNSRRIPDTAPTETEDPLESNDKNLPAGSLANALATMDTPDYGARASGKRSENAPASRLDRDVQWSSAQDVPSDFMTGATTMIPGGGF